MSLAIARQKREERAAIFEKAKTLLAKDSGKLSPDDRTAYDKMIVDMDALKGDIDRNERAAAIEAELAAPITGGKGEDRVDDGVKETAEVRAKKEFAAKHSKAFRSFLVNGEGGLEAEERSVLNKARAEARDMGVATGSLGGFFVPQGFVNDIESAMKWYGEMLNVCSFLDTSSGNLMPYPTDNDTTNTGELVGEGVQVSAQDVSIGHIQFNAWKFSTKMIKVSIELVQDSAFDIEAYIKDKASTRLGRILNTKLTTGSGTNEPNGIMTAAVAGPTAIGSSTNTGGAETGGTSVGSTDLTNLEFSIDRAYRRGAAYMMHDLSFKKVRLVLDKFGRPLWQPSLAVNAPDTINGYPYFLNNDMTPIPDAASAGNNTILFGQLKKYTTRRVKQLAIQRLTERFADYGQIAYIGFARYDGQLLDAGTNPVKYLVQAAS